MSEEQKQPNEQKKKPIYMSIVGANLIAVVVYTVLCAVGGGEGLIFSAFLIVIHAIACIIVAPFAKKWEWVLAGVLVVAVGFSTCAGLFSISDAKL
ncbi:hypothetical protein EOD41_01620 [Mucilaginibacter limnophilus]|uniref:Uncharacterized protein n=1 Tax=Mucilaginibacter limnophilus TaxID=1932778 RepID=A0A437MYC7_9SPHI|nr:hypothetical protein [Mucilaginibacter limnophilus]RVU02664.1 hypothetical protein EOD41_01620 [Mucilaginibacter limnophilus]